MERKIGVKRETERKTGGPTVFADALGMVEEWQREQIEDPRWEECNSRRLVHDWRTYVPLEVQARWNDLGLDAKIAVYLTGTVAADREEWD